MNAHSLTAALAALALAAAPLAQSQPAQTANAQPAAASVGAVQVPANPCVAPVYPSKERTEHLKPEAINKTIDAFNHDYKTYGECIKKYVEDTKQLLKVVTEAGNKAIEDWNKYNTDLHEQMEADKK